MMYMSPHAFIRVDIPTCQSAACMNPCLHCRARGRHQRWSQRAYAGSARGASVLYTYSLQLKLVVVYCRSSSCHFSAPSSSSAWASIRPKVLLLHGPPGTGKTLLACGIACWTQDRSFILPCGYNCCNSPVWFVSFLLGAYIKVPSYAHL